MFDIAFIQSKIESLREFLGPGAVGLRGRIVLGGYSEEFVALIETWGRADYERHWREAAARLVAGADRTAFFTSAFETRWTMWRQGDGIVVQEHFLSAPGFPEPFDPGDLYTHIRDLPADPAERRVSEWMIDLDAVRDFLRRRAGECW
jgi:hypothetical protein